MAVRILSKFARVVKGVDLRSTGHTTAWVRTPQLALRVYVFVAFQREMQMSWGDNNGIKMETPGFEPGTLRMRSGCDTTTPHSLKNYIAIYQRYAQFKSSFTVNRTLRKRVRKRNTSPTVGLEPTTIRLRAWRSTDWARRAVLMGKSRFEFWTFASTCRHAVFWKIYQTILSVHYH